MNASLFDDDARPNHRATNPVLARERATARRPAASEAEAATGEF